MAGLVNISSTAEWDKLLAGTTVVIADFYADWCGPCKMIAPHFEKLANQYSKPKKIAFAKVNVDNQSAISRSNGVAAMPTFKIFHSGTCVETIKGANPPALADAVQKAAKLADGGAGAGHVFASPGRTLGGNGQGSQNTGANFGGLFGRLMNVVFVFVGLYLVSLFSFDSLKAARESSFNPEKRGATTMRKTAAGWVQPGENKAGGKGDKKAAAAAQKPAFRTLADLGN